MFTQICRQALSHVHELLLHLPAAAATLLGAPGEHTALDCERRKGVPGGLDPEAIKNLEPR